jgi:hypothetical protein
MIRPAAVNAAKRCNAAERRRVFPFGHFESQRSHIPITIGRHPTSSAGLRKTLSTVARKIFTDALK